MITLCLSLYLISAFKKYHCSLLIIVVLLDTFLIDQFFSEYIALFKQIAFVTEVRHWTFKKLQDVCAVNGFFFIYDNHC